MSVPDVTVVVAVWDDYCDYLPECLGGALADAGVVNRVVVVENASTRPVPTLPERAEVLHTPRRLTVGAARNLGLEEVETPFVTFLDADDVPLPGALRFLRDRLASEPRAVTALGRQVSWDPRTDERRVLMRSPKPVTVRTSRFRRLFALANLRYNTFPVVGCVHRTEAVRAAGGFGDGDVGEDWILGALLAFRGRILFHEQPGFLRRVHEGSLWHRSHSADRLLHRGELLRARAAADPSVPRWAKATLPLMAHLHRRDVRRATRGGSATIVHPLLARDGRP